VQALVADVGAESQAAVLGVELDEVAARDARSDSRRRTVIGAFVVLILVPGRLVGALYSIWGRFVPVTTSKCDAEVEARACFG
jgi:hypothetical protein